MERRYADSDLITADTTVKSAPGYVKSLTISWKGATVGDFVSLVNHAANNTPNLDVFVFSTVNGTITRNYGGEGKFFSTAIRVNVGATVGQVYASLQYC